MVIMMEFNVNNVSTIATTIWVSVIAPILLYFGVTIDQGLGTAVITGILTVVFMIWNAKNPNEFAALGNKPNDPVTEDGILNDEYVTGDTDDSQ